MDEVCYNSIAGFFFFLTSGLCAKNYIVMVSKIILNYLSLDSLWLGHSSRLVKEMNTSQERYRKSSYLQTKCLNSLTTWEPQIKATLTQLPMCQTGTKCSSGQTGQRCPRAPSAHSLDPATLLLGIFPADTAPAKLGHTDTSSLKWQNTENILNAHI